MVLLLVKLKQLRKIFAKMMVVFLGIILFVLLLAELYIKPPLLDIAAKRVHNILQEAVYEGVKESCEDLGYNKNLVRFEQDAQGRVVFVQSDSVYMGQLAGQISTYINKAIMPRLPLDMELPLGALLGGSVFSASGPAIHIELIAAAAQQVEIRSEFAAAGINQTRHMIYLYANLNSRVAIPLQKQDFSTEVKVPLSEYVIIGSVPDTYVDFKMP